MKAVIVGTGGHAAVVLEAVAACRSLEVIGALDPSPAPPGLPDVRVIGDDDMLDTLRGQGVEAVVLAVGNNRLRAAIGERAIALGYRLPPVIHPGALISPSACVRAGAIVMARAVVGTRVHVGRFAIVNTGAIIDHDGVIGDSAHVAPGVALAGNVTVGARALIGVGSAARPQVTIGEDAVVGAGSAIVADVEAGVLVAGSPARRRPS